MIRLEVDYAFNVRAGRRERRLKDGRLVKTTIFRNCESLEAALAEARANKAACDEIAPNGAEVIEVRGYDQEAYLVSPTDAVLLHRAATL